MIIWTAIVQHYVYRRQCSHSEHCAEQKKQKRTCVHAYIRIKLCIQFLHGVLKYERNINTYRIWTLHIIFLHASKCEKLCMRMYKYQIHFRLAIFFLYLHSILFSSLFSSPTLSLTLYSIGCFSIFLFVSFVLSFPNFMRYIFFTRAQSHCLSLVRYSCLCVCAMVCVWVYVRFWYTFSPCRFATSHV